MHPFPSRVHVTALASVAFLASACGSASSDHGAPSSERPAGVGSHDAANAESEEVTSDGASGATPDGGASASDAGGNAPDAGQASVATDASGPGDTGGAPNPAADAGGPAGPVAAFPGAYGFGRTATGGRMGAVYHVTTLADSGPGSLRDAVSTGPRIVVFDVGGTITLSTPVSAKSNLTIAGQTAPGDGVAIVGREVSFSGSTNDIVRYMRFRQGTLDSDNTKSGINLLNATTMIFDHVSIEFAQWNNIDSVGAKSITVQHSISADPIGQQFAAHTETGPYTWYGNLFANAHNRCPLAKANTQYVNNVVYNYQAGYTAGNTAGVFSHDVVGNYFIAGPSTTSASNAFYQVNNQPIFNSGNLLDSNKDGMLDGSALVDPGGAVVLTAAWSPDTAAIPTVSATDAYADVVAHAGASLHRDQVDAQVIANVTSLGTAGSLWTSQSATGLANGGYGTVAGGTAPVDTDGDGMPDAWELRYGLNPNSPADANGDFDGTGYTNIEKYINGLVDGSYP